MEFGYVLQQFLNGLTLGAIYGLIAIGYTMVFGIIGMVNVAHGDIFMIGSFLSLIGILILTGLFGLPPSILALVLVLLTAMALTSLYNWTIERVAYRPLRGSSRLAPLISAIGMSILLSNFVQVTQGARNKPLAPFSEGGFWLYEGSFPVIVSYKQILIVMTTVALLAIFWWVIRFTRLGRAQRACAQDRTMASILGVHTDQTISMTFVIGAALAAVAGMLYLVQYGVISFSDGFVPGVKAFTAAVLGGIGSLPGAVLGGLLIGLIETFWSAYFSIEYKDIASFSVLILMLIFLPQGILGRPEVEKV